MKKVLWISGIFAGLLLPLVWIGWTNADKAASQALRSGNVQYEEGRYAEALETYVMGLESMPEHQALNFNAAQAAYQLGEYTQASEYYDKAAASIDKYLNAGNSLYRAGEVAEDDNQRLQYYNQALQIYKEGIINYPHDVQLKFNYEFVKQKLDELSEQIQKDDPEDQQNDQEQNNMEENEQEQNNQQNEDTNDQQNGERNDEQNEDMQSPGEEDQTREAIARILDMLASEEEESLKNNQGVVRGRDDKYGW